MTSRCLVRGLLVLWMWNITSTADGYELFTHARISQQAFDASAALQVYLGDVGIDPDKKFDPDDKAAASTAFTIFTNSGSVRDWLGAGAIREDDYLRSPFREALGCTPAQNPQDPNEDVNRPLNHFFDVQRGGRGLPGMFGFFDGLPAPDWALGLQGRGPDANQNHFSLPDARTYQLASLAGTTRNERERNTALLFRTLGQVTHVLQDMAQPQHTRNDPHAGCFQLLAGERSWYEVYTETRADRTNFPGRGLISPDLKLGDYDPVRLGAYRDFWTNSLGSGLADFSSRNFFSAGTNLSDRNRLFDALLGRCGGLSAPICDPAAYRTKLEKFNIPSIDGKILSGDVTLYLNDMTDPVTLAPITGVAVSSRSIWDQHLETRQLRQSFSLNSLNYDSIADVLLPRAVGYSAGLLDYFFRNRLDVNLFEDPLDPTKVRIQGTNAATRPDGQADPLVNGTLKLYADNVDTGIRSEVPSLDAAATINVAGGGQITSPQFVLPDDSERFVAVYKGTLGQELENPGANVPGGVMGKVLGGVRVEEIFLNGNQWTLRTPKGIFPLPISRPDVVDLHWGDRDNTLVGRSAFGTDQPNQMFAWQIDRPVGSLDVPLVNGVVKVTPMGDPVPFPFGLDIGGVELNSALHYRQFLISIFQTLVIDTDGSVLSSTVTGTNSEVIVEDSASATISWRLTLDADKLSNFRARPHIWEIQQIGLTTDGRIVALVLITLNPAQNFAFFPSIQYVPTCPSTECASPPTIQDGPPDAEVFGLGRVGRAIFAVVDVSQGRLLYSTAPPTVVINNLIEITRFRPSGASASFGGLTAALIQKNVFQNGGASYKLIGAGAFTCTPTKGPSFDVDVKTGTFQAAHAHLRPELAALDFPSAASVISTTAGDTCVGPVVAHATMQEGKVGLSFTDRAQRAADGSERVLVVLDLLTLPTAPTFGNQRSKVVAWDPLQSTARLRKEFDITQPGERQILGVGHDLAVVRTPFPPLVPPYMTVIPLEGDGQPQTFTLENTASDKFTVIPPRFLFNGVDTKFYRSLPDLARTALPRTLFPGAPSVCNFANLSSSQRCDFHGMRVP